MPRSKPEATFKSYIDNGETNSLQDANGPVDSIALSGLVDSFKEGYAITNPMEPQLLKGEQVIAQALTVVKFMPYTERTRAISGTLFCTNFKLTFIPADKGEDGNSFGIGESNKLLGEDDIALTNVDAVYQVEYGPRVSNTKRKRLTRGANISGSVKNLEIHCKDFRIHTFNFKCTPKQEAKVMALAVVTHAFPNRHELLFAMGFKHYRDSESNGSSHRMFRTSEDWDKELERLNIRGYRTTMCNSAFRLSQTMPECFVVPTGLTNADLTSVAPQFQSYRPPCWSFTCPNGSSLVRMAYLVAETSQTYVEPKCIDAVKGAHPKNAEPKVYDLEQVLPSLTEIQSSFVKLKELLMPVSRLEYEESDPKWYSRLDKTEWLKYVAQCLSVSLRVADIMMQKEKSVILRESDARDLCALVSSVSQLLLDPESRTQAGFQRLVEREWVVLGHKFVERSGLLSDNEGEECYLFLMFLDCVWQLLQQFPSAFQFSETYLAILWDSVCLGLFEQFVFNCDHERIFNNRRYVSHGLGSPGSGSSHTLLSVWDWNAQLGKELLSLCNNPLYLTKTELKLNLPHSKSMAETYEQTGGKEMLNKAYSRKLGEIYEVPPAEGLTGYLRPVVSAPLLSFWSHLYLRWLVPAQIVAGGSPSEYLHQCILVEEIICLQDKLNALKKSTPFTKAQRRSSELFFSCDGSPVVRATPSSNKHKWSENLTSSFPFSPGPVTNKMTFIGTPISLFLENSMLLDDMESIDGQSDTERDGTS